ncbi:MAG: capsular polysaccharide biosynthesis protein [Eubacteriales bacterium]|nr:capsular polysaccharide biosynthesis protein [Eubacteriales bacterium]
MSELYDFHSHVLPGIDDGSKSVEESLAMLTASAEQGVGVMAATPHFYADEQSIERFLRRRQRAWDRLRDHLEDGMPQLRLGAEVHYFEGICSTPGLLDLRLQGTKILLLEMPFCRWSDRMVRDIRELNSRPEIVVLLAHIERYLREQPAGVIDELLADRVRLQCNASIFCNWRTRRRAMRMLDNDQIYLLGSDSHNMTTRPPALGKAAEAIRSKLGQQALDKVGRRAERLLADA